MPEIKKTQYSFSIFILAIVPDIPVKKDSARISGLDSKRENRKNLKTATPEKKWFIIKSISQRKGRIIKRNEKISSAMKKKFPNSQYKYFLSSLMVLKRITFSLFHNIIDLFFPENCPGCNGYRRPEKYCFCYNCLQQIIPSPSPNNKIFSLAVYEGPVKQAIHCLKYKKRKWIAISLAEWMNDFLNQHHEIKYDIIVPVPLHPIKEFQRSFNQSWLIAYYLARLQKKTALYSCLVKIKNNRSQTDLNNVERKQNVRDVYRVKRSSLIKDKNILVIDDVYTTGATAEEVYKTLKNSGAKTVFVLTVAKA